MTDKPDRFVQKAAQLWCLPQHGKKEMDAEFAMNIAQAIREAAAEAFEEAAKMSMCRDVYTKRMKNTPLSARMKAKADALRGGR